MSKDIYEILYNLRIDPLHDEDEAKQAIQDLITKAKIDEVEVIRAAFEDRNELDTEKQLEFGLDAINERLNQLKEQTK